MKNIILFFIIGVIQLCLDAAMFTLFVNIGISYVLANFFSRGLAALSGYWLNGKHTFRKKLSLGNFIKFWMYWLLMTCLSSLLILLFRHLLSGVVRPTYIPLALKVIVEFILFFISFFIAKLWVYKNE